MADSYDKTKKYRLLEEVGFRRYFKAETWADFNRQFFDGLAPKYDRLNEVLSLGQHHRIKREAIQSLDLNPKAKVLDLCTGSGDIAIDIAKHFPYSHVVGIDASEKMLEIARSHARGLGNIEFKKADALKLPFENETFDAVIISFGLRNLEDLKAGILEMKRVTKSGGKIMNLDLGTPENLFLRWFHAVYFGRLIPLLGRILFHRGEFNSFHYLPASRKYFPNQRELVEILNELCPGSVQRRDYMLGAISQQTAVISH